MKKHKFGYKTETRWVEREGQGGCSYSSTYTAYIVFVDGQEEQTFDREWAMYEYLNKTYFPKKWQKDLEKIKKLKKEIEAKLKQADKIDSDMKSMIY